MKNRKLTLRFTFLKHVATRQCQNPYHVYGICSVASGKCSALWQQATIEITRRDHSVIACSRHVYKGVVLRAHSVRGEPRIQRKTTNVRGNDNDYGFGTKGLQVSLYRCRCS